MRSGERPGREADLRYSAGRAQRGRGRSPLLIWALHVVSRGWRHHGRERGPFGFSRWGRGKNCRGQRFGEGASRAQRSSRSPRSPKEIHSPRRQANPRMRKSNHQQQPNNPVAAEKVVGTPFKIQQNSDFARGWLCLRLMPTVGIIVGTPVGTAPRQTRRPFSPEAVFARLRGVAPLLPTPDFGWFPLSSLMPLCRLAREKYAMQETKTWDVCCPSLGFSGQPGGKNKGSSGSSGW